MEKFYRVIKENFLWEVGAILEMNESGKGFKPIEDIYYKIENCTEYISTYVIENSPEYFERVYKVNLATKVVYELKEEAKKLLQSSFKS